MAAAVKAAAPTVRLGAAVAATLLAVVLAGCGAGPVPSSAALPAPVGAPSPAPVPAPVPAPADEPAPPERTEAPSSGRTQVPPATVELDGLRPAPVGLADVADGGFLAVPEDISKLGWWVGSAPMGAPRGTTLIAGHVDSKVAGLGVFAKLREMDAGDGITVVDGLGTEWRFAVSRTEQVIKAELPRTLFDTTGERRLALITCGGPFNPTLRSYRDNLIVWAEPV